jgi:putative phosphoesterase
VQVHEDGAFRLTVVSDTHSKPHERAYEAIAESQPNVILHAGDIGDVRVLDDLATIAQVFAVRGNIDQRLPGIPDVFVIELAVTNDVILRLMMLHVGVYGPRLRAEVTRMARVEKASIVVCGHSHVPFIGRERELTVFNPGSIGPRRFGLPIVFGTLDVSRREVSMRHIDCETGLLWEPPGSPGDVT